MNEHVNVRSVNRGENYSITRAVSLNERGVNISLQSIYYMAL